MPMDTRYFTPTQAKRRLALAFPCSTPDQINSVVEAMPRQEVPKLLIPEAVLIDFIAEQEILFETRGYDEMGGVR